MHLLRLACVLALIACGSADEPAPSRPAASSTPQAAPPPAATAERPADPPVPDEPLPEAPPSVPSAPQPQVVRALARLPADSRFVIGIDMPRIANGALGGLLRASFAKQAPTLPASCASLSVTQLGQVVAAGAAKGGQTGEALVGFLDRALKERVVIPCVKDVMKSKGGELKSKRVLGHTAHFATGTPDDNAWITWTKDGTPVLAAGEAWLAATLDPKAAKIAPALADLASRADHGRMIWAAAEITPDDARGWGLPEDLVAAPVAVRAAADLTDEIEVDVVAAFKTADEANRVAALLRAQIGQLRRDPTARSLLSAIRLRLGVHGTEVRVMAHPDAETTAVLLKILKLT
jgi:hypothetical protein